MKVFISGKITGDNHYREHFHKAEETLKNDGFIVLNPSVLPQGMTSAEYMRICLNMFECSDIIYMLNNYKDSKGALVELTYAQYLGLDVMYE